MDIEQILKYLLPIIPEPLRRHVATGIVLLVCEVLIETELEGLPLSEIVRSRYFLASACLACLYWLFICIRARHNLRRAILLLFTSLFFAVAVATGYGFVRRYDQVYNELGFFQGRTWTRSETQPPDETLGRWRWDMQAVEDLSSKRLTVRMSLNSCAFEDFSPEVSPSGFRPTITDISTDPVHSDAWRIEDLHRPSELTFYLVVKGRPQELRCPLPQINMTAKP